MSCPMCMGTDSAADCTAGRCRFQEEIEAEGRVRAAELEEERRVNDALAAKSDDDWPDTVEDYDPRASDFL